MNEIVINRRRGVNNILFGMSPGDVGARIGPAEEVTSSTGAATEQCRRIEIRSKVDYFYENNQFVCVSGKLTTPFSLEGEKIPFTQFETISFLKSKSELNVRFADIMSYVFFDLGIVLYPHTVVDMEAGIKTTTTTQRLSLCNREVLTRYFDAFIVNNKRKGYDLDSCLLKEIGNYLEKY